MRAAVKVRGEDVFINTNIVRWWDELAGYFTYEFNCSMPPPFPVIAVWFAVEKHVFHCHIARRIGIW